MVLVRLFFNFYCWLTFNPWRPLWCAPVGHLNQVDLWVVVAARPKEGFRATNFAYSQGEWGYRGDPREPVSEYFICGKVIPTHWMPLPLSPNYNRKKTLRNKYER